MYIGNRRMMMTVDRTLILGLAGLMAIAAALGAQSNTAAKEPSYIVDASMRADANCPDGPTHKAVGILSEQPVGSLALVLL
jgi:hypothetical protein